MSTRALFPILFASLLTPVMVAMPTGDAIAQSFGGKVRNVRIRIRRSTFDYSVTTSTLGSEFDNAEEVEFQFEEPFEGPSPQENPLLLTREGYGHEVRAPGANDGPFYAGEAWSLAITPVADDGAPVGEPILLGQTQDLTQTVDVGAQVSWEPDVFFDVITMVGLTDEECYGCVAVELAPSAGTPDWATPGALHIQGVTIQPADTRWNPPPRTLDSISESLVATQRWRSNQFEFDDEAVGSTYLTVATVRDAEGNTLGEPVETTVVVGEEAEDDTGPTPTVTIGDHDGDLEFGADDVALVTGNVTGNITVAGGTLILTGSTVTGDIVIDGGNLELNDAAVFGLLQTEGEVTISGSGGDFSGDLLIASGGPVIDGAAVFFRGADQSGSRFGIYGGGSLILDEDANMTIDGGNLEIHDSSSFTIGGSSTINVSGGSVVFSDDSRFQVDDSSNFNIVGGSLSVTEDASMLVIQSSIVVIDGGNLLLNDNSAFTIGGPSILTVDGGNIEFSDSSSFTVPNTTVTISSGNFQLSDNVQFQAGGSSTIDVTGGDFLANDASFVQVGDSSNLTVRGGNIRFQEDSLVTANGDFVVRGRQGTVATLDGTITAGETLDVRTRGDGGSLTVNGTVSAGTHLDLRTRGDNGDLTVTGAISAQGDVDLKTRGDGAALTTTLPIVLASDEFGPGRIFLRTRGNGSPLTIEPQVTIQVDLGELADVDFEAHVSGNGSDLTVNDVIEAEGNIDMRVTGGGDLTVNDTISAGTGDIFLRNRNGGNIALTCDLAVESGICLGGGLSITLVGDEDITVGMELEADLVDLDAGGDLTVDGDINAGDLFAYGGGYRAPSTTRIGGICILSGLARVDGGEGSVLLDGSIDALHSIDLSSDTTTTVDGSLTSGGSVTLYAGDGTTLTEGSTLDWLDHHADVVGPTDLDGGSWLFEGDESQYRPRRRGGRYHSSDIVTINIYDGDRD